MKRHLLVVYNITITGLSLNIDFANCLFAIRKHIFAFENTHDNYYYVLFRLKYELQVNSKVKTGKVRYCPNSVIRLEHNHSNLVI